MPAPAIPRDAADRPTREAALSPVEEVLDLLGGATAALLPLLLLSVPGILLFFVLPLILLAIPALAIAIMVAPPLLLLRLVRRTTRRRRDRRRQPAPRPSAAVGPAR